MDTHDPELVERANTLYWESDASVNEIADQLDLSKGALYGMVQPLDAGAACPECGGPLEFENRTARDKEIVTCPKCSLEEDFSLVQAVELESVTDDVPPPPPSALVPVAGEGHVPMRTMVASALIAFAAGIAIGQWSRGR